MRFYFVGTYCIFVYNLNQNPGPNYNNWIMYRYYSPNIFFYSGVRKM